jgi:mannose-6-phosphate isomerase-like protein (cupin superfamily)
MRDRGTLPTITITQLAGGPTPPRAGDTWPNVLHTRIAEVVARMGAPPWACRLIQDERQLVTLIASPPGGGNRPHWHRDFDEWWVVLAGRLEWELTGGITLRADKDDIVWVPRGAVHHIRNPGEALSLRLAVAMPPATHYFSPCEQCGYADDGPREWRA